MSRSRRARFLATTTVLMSAGMLYAPVRSFAQDTSSAEVKNQGTRKVKTMVKPVYPEIAHKMQITGTVRLEATVGPDGKVRETKVIGGSPVLVQEATIAVKKWRFEEAPKETVETVEFSFQ
jgi:TonB family protein